MGTTGLSCAISVALLLTFCFVVHAQQGFVSIDCGKPADYSSNDTRAVSYTSDAAYIDTGENRQISLSIAAATPDPKLQDLRSFPQGKRNCYALPVVEGRSYLVRAYFLYGNYDGLDAAPQFDLYLGTNLWSKVSISNSSSVYVHEMIAYAVDSSIQVCLVNTSSWRPFVSALELRPFNTSRDVYPANSSQSLKTVAMIDFGGQSPIKYPEDKYDRIWTPYLPPGSTTLSSPRRVYVYEDTSVPSEVMQTAATPATGSTLSFSWPVDGSRGELYYHFVRHFAELKSLAANETRAFKIADNGLERIAKVVPKYLDADSWSSAEPHLYSKLDFSLSEAPGSSLPPIINAMEIFEVRFLDQNFTNIADVEAMLAIKKAYQLQKNWMGDPCAPKDFLWDGLRCTYDVEPYRIISLDLSNSGLVGTLPTSLAKLTELQYLDLSSNKLSGGIPAFFTELSNITFLNLTCSGLSGTVPKALQDRAASQLLNITAAPCLRVEPRKSYIVEALAASVGIVALLLVIVGLIFWLKRHHSQPEEASTSVNETLSMSECTLFGYKELVKMTNNFSQLLGEGGSCSVFHGHLNNGTPVAVKKLSASESDAAYKQFKDEVTVLREINHRYLITLIGYCKDKKNLALVYEFMPGGSLADRLSAANNDGRGTLSWRDRVRIAYEAAQGLQYLHDYSRKTVIHRDVKPSNILLTADNSARVSDFGVSKTITTRSQARQTVAGTPGYADPEYWNQTRIPTKKSDVYSFGVILLELITGLPPIITRENGSVENLVQQHRRRSLSSAADLDERVLDSRLRGSSYNPDSIRATLKLAADCTERSGQLRPTMRQVVDQLKECLEPEDMREQGGGPSACGSAATNDDIFHSAPSTRSVYVTTHADNPDGL